MKKRLLLAGGAVVVVVALALHDVTLRPTAANTLAAAEIMGSSDFATPKSFDEQIALIARVQRLVLAAAPIDKGLSTSQSRELPDLIRAGYGLCYDRSRAIETILQLYGMKTRHAAIYSTAETSALLALLTPSTASHAVSEVLTDRGWLVVDSNAAWLGIAEDGSVLDLADISTSDDLPPGATPILYQPFLFVYGLYSRHGFFYAPFTPIPDLSWPELRFNVFPA